ncbi:MAG TPA: nucleotidyltransferase domain-containing protein [Pyrinomonadaceae bacterium]|nr:nucleotidyltransferase domain-containing protein [Pyrinomonadaceae bacterium]
MTQINLKGLSPEQVSALLPEGLISLCWRGSVAHGMYVPKNDPDSIDDKDVMGVYIGPLEHYLGFDRKDVYEKWEGEWDCVFYELRKFVGLLLNCNPNVLSFLWVKANGIIFEGPLGAKLRERRDLFVTRKAFHSFSGYAHDQFKKMISFNQEAQALMQRMEEQLMAFGIDPDSSEAGNALRGLDGKPFVGATTEMMDVVKRFRGERRRFYSGGYMGKKRRELVRRVGYDAKNAAHLIRLLRMSIEFLTEGTLYVERADAVELLDIKRGVWPLEKVKAEAERLFQLAQEAYVRSPLPSEPDHRAAEHLCVELISEFHGLKFAAGPS